MWITIAPFVTLTSAHREALDRLLESSDNQPSRLTWLLQPPGKINGKNVLQHIDRLNSIESLALPEGMDRTIHQNRLLKLARQGRKMSSRDLTRFSAARRHAILVCVLEDARATLTDEIIELHERILNSLFNKAKKTQAERLQQTGRLIQLKLKQYIDIGQALSEAHDSGEDPWLAIEKYCHGLNLLPAWKKLVILPERIILTRYILLPKNTAHYGNMLRVCYPPYN